MIKTSILLMTDDMNVLFVRVSDSLIDQYPEAVLKW